MIRRLLALAILIASIVINTCAPSLAQQSGGFATKAKQAILIDANSGAILFQVNADELVPPASMSKLMTLAVLFRALRSGEVKLEDEFVMSVNAWRKGGAPSGTSAMFVPVNTKTTVEELIQGIIVQSGNDACIAVAEALSGTEEAFARRMVAEARRIGLTKSEFRNATGLYHPEHLMTVRELAMLAGYLIKEYPEYYKIFAQRDFKYRKHRFINRNPLLFADIGADGLKTGYIKEAGYGIVGSAVQDGRRLIAVLNGMASANERRDEGRKLLEWGFRSLTSFKLFDADEVVGHARVWGGTRIYLPLTGRGEVSVVLPKFPANQKLRAEIIYKGPLKPPIQKGSEVATLRITTSSNATSEVPLYAGEDVGQGGVIRRGLDSLVYMAFGWAML